MRLTFLGLEVSLILNLKPDHQIKKSNKKENCLTIARLRLAIPLVKLGSDFNLFSVGELKLETDFIFFFLLTERLNEPEHRH